MVFPGGRNAAYPSMSSGCPWKSAIALLIVSRVSALWDNRCGLRFSQKGGCRVLPSGLEVHHIDEVLILRRVRPVNLLDFVQELECRFNPNRHP